MQGILNNSNYYYELYEADYQISEEIKAKGCPHCTGPLHQANYPRSPRGAPEGIDQKYHIRFSLCCGVEGYRKRLTPPSLRIMGAKVYSSMIIVLIFLCKGNHNQKISAINAHYLSEWTLSEETVRRWQHYWQHQFPASLFYKKQSSLLQLPRSSLPISLLKQFKGTLACQLFHLLQHLLPLSTSSNYVMDSIDVNG